jgi:hypothetical protein
MADLGAFAIMSPSDAVSLGSGWGFGVPLDLSVLTIVDSGGSGGIPVDPKRFLNVGGTAVPIQ